jgi:hypothetical protein
MESQEITNIPEAYSLPDESNPFNKGCIFSNQFK